MQRQGAAGGADAGRRRTDPALREVAFQGPVTAAVELPVPLETLIRGMDVGKILPRADQVPVTLALGNTQDAPIGLGCGHGDPLASTDRDRREQPLAIVRIMHAIAHSR